MYQGLGTVFWLFLVEKRVDKTPLLELRFKCKNQTKKTQKVGLVMSVFILAKKTTENKNFTMRMEF